MVKEIHGESTRENVELFKDLENRFPVTVTIQPGGSESKTIFKVTETEEGAVGAAFFGEMKQLMDYSILCKLLESKENAVQETDKSLVPEVATTQTPNEVSRLLALWNRISEVLRSKTPTLHGTKT